MFNPAAGPSSSRLAWRLVRAAAVVVLSAGYFALVFQVPQGLPFRNGIGDWIDPYFINYLLEHWYYSVRHATDPATLTTFFPARWTLGYSHALILYAPVYAAVRPWLHPFLAHNLTIFLVMETGALCLYRLLRREWRLSCVESVVIGALFVTSANVANGFIGPWSQRASVFLIPPILVVAFASRRVASRFGRLAGAGLAGLTAGLLLTQDFYTGMLGALVAALLALGAVLLPGRLSRLRRAAGIWPANRGWTVAFLTGMAASGIVFLWIYYVPSREFPSFPRQQIIEQLVTREPTAWRGPLDVMRSLGAYNSLRTFQLVFVLGILAWLPWFRSDGDTRRYAAWFLFVSVLVLLVPIRVHKWSLWTTVFMPLPGFGAIRDPKRIIYLYELAAAIAVGAFTARLPVRSARRIGTVALALFLLAAEWNQEPVDFARPIPEFDRWVDAPLAIDPSCRSFFLRRPSDTYLSRSSNKATFGGDTGFIALKTGIPTLNGYSAWEPAFWALGDPTGDSYEELVRRWAARHALRGVCALDIDTRIMTPFVSSP